MAIPTSPSQPLPTSGSPPAQRPNHAPSPSHSKPCTLCQTPRDVLVRCRVDASQTWHFVCPGKCWRGISGGEIDGPDKPYYHYGGMWKNKHAGVSAKKPRKKNKQVLGGTGVREWSAEQVRYTTNDRVRDEGLVWVCRRSHESGEKSRPGVTYRYWKEYGSAASGASVRSEGSDADGLEAAAGE
ncbi:hypothetical protein MMC13_005147 [Lambiella insularis]|nr:hypothetical protein [Lambiella insularis]